MDKYKRNSWMKKKENRDPCLYNKDINNAIKKFARI